tara:strand:- start:4372 stop:4896 length:525 start_codon:yes stop_codon:yes gene_type:complete
MSTEIAEHLMKEYDFLVKKDFWDCHGTPIIKHYALLQVAEKNLITFGSPDVLDIDLKNRICCIGIHAKMGDKIEYDIGEACPENCTNAYTTAMAIKRAKDRAIIKILGLYGKVYSDADVIQDKEGNKAFAEDIQVWQGTTEEQVAKAKAEVDNLKKQTKIDLKEKIQKEVEINE